MVEGRTGDDRDAPMATDGAGATRERKESLCRVRRVLVPKGYPTMSRKSLQILLTQLMEQPNRGPTNYRRILFNWAAAAALLWGWNLLLFSPQPF